MVSFDLTDILKNSNVSVDLKPVQELTYTMQKDVTTMVGNIPNLTIGLSPDEGVSVTSVPNSEYLRDFITHVLMKESSTVNIHCSQVYRDHVYQVLIATGYIPVGWIYQNSSNSTIAENVLTALRNTWNLIVSDYIGFNAQRDLIYTKIKSFGLVLKTKTVGKKMIDWYLVAENQQEYDHLNVWVRDNHIKNVFIFTSAEYEKALVDSSNRFLIHFDKVIDPFVGISFRAVLNAKESVPTYLATVGCDEMCMIELGADKSEYQIMSPRYVTKQFKRLQPIETLVKVPTGYVIDFVTVNGTPYFIGTYAMVAAGIEISPMDVTTLTGYQLFKVTVSGQTSSVSIYIDACQDFTKVGFEKQVISPTRSTIGIGEEDIALNIIFNFPFLLLNQDKISVFARKDDESEEEQISRFQIIETGQSYVERIVSFGKNSRTIAPAMPQMSPMMNGPMGTPGFIGGKPMDGPSNPDPSKRRDNPNVIHHLPPPTMDYGNQVPVIDGSVGQRVMIFGVSQCSAISIVFDGYTDYKYFRVSFDDYAMIAYCKLVGKLNSVDVIPVIEDFRAINPTIIEEEQPSEEEPGENPPIGGEEEPSGSGSAEEPEENGGSEEPSGGNSEPGEEGEQTPEENGSNEEPSGSGTGTTPEPGSAGIGAGTEIPGIPEEED